MISISLLIKQVLLNSGKSMGLKTTKKLLAVYLKLNNRWQSDGPLTSEARDLNKSGSRYSM